MPQPHPHSLAACLCALCPAAAAQSAPLPPTWPTFLKLSKSQQAEVAAQLTRNLPTTPQVLALRRLAAEAATGTASRTQPRTARRGKRTIEFPHEGLPLPLRCDYVFGVGTIDAREVAPAGRAAGAKHKATQGMPLLKPAEPLLVHQALLGCVPDADLALAVLLQRLDVDPAGDAFAAFLQSWRNGDESFYEALDRTAGTKDSVFFFDAMLDDFRGLFGGADGGHALRGGLQQAHDALHDAFLAYRQYRGFREAVAWSLVLSPDQPLPARLGRYEAKARGAYSLREQVTMAAAVMDHDVDRILAAIAETAAKLPQPIWSGTYDPYPAWNATFMRLLPTMIERAGSSDAFLQQELSARRQTATAIAMAAERLIAKFAAAPPGH